ncbi:GumC family protein [Corticibacterium sp. UT-5YL-CI-8]|nr:GumC family protein [Tianweitania sp. UT-5YL-CI-8]
MYKPSDIRERQAGGAKAAAPSAGGGSLLDLAGHDEPQVASYTQPRVISPKAQPPAEAEPSAPEVAAPVVTAESAFMERIAAIGVFDVLQWLKRGIAWILLLTILCVGGAYAYAKFAPPRYTVYTDLVIDPTSLQVVQNDVFASNPQRDTQLLEVESKLRVLTSRNVMARVIERLNLTQDQEFVGPGPWAPLLAYFGVEPEPVTDSELAAMRALNERITARREERSFVVSLEVWSEDPAKAVRISDAIVEAFQQEVFQASAESAARVATSLNDRLDELRSNVRDAEDRVETFRRENGLQGTSGGDLLSTRLATELNIQVLDAQQRLIQAETRYNEVRAAVQQGDVVSAATLQSPALTSMRAEYSSLQQQVASLAMNLGARHPRLASMRSQLGIVQQSITDEARRILGTAKADMDQARSTLDALRARAETEKSNVFSDNEAQVQLRALEREARASAALYETYLTRAQQVTERQQLDTSNIQVISKAVPPQARSWPPRTVILLAAGAFAGIALGMGLALLFGFMRYMRDPEPVPAR